MAGVRDYARCCYYYYYYYYACVLLLVLLRPSATTTTTTSTTTTTTTTTTSLTHPTPLSRYGKSILDETLDKMEQDAAAAASGAKPATIEVRALLPLLPLPLLPWHTLSQRLPGRHDH